jgi:stage V sporulation protein G
MDDNVQLSVERINKLDNTGHAKAFCDVTIGRSFLVKGIKVVEGKEGLFVSMPQERGKDEKWYSTFIPLTPQVYQELSEVVLEAYHAEEAPA